MAEPTYEELKARLEQLEKQGPKRTGNLEFRVGEKGGVSVYGLGRFPVTLYYEQWIRLLDLSEQLASSWKTTSPNLNSRTSSRLPRQRKT